MQPFFCPSLVPKEKSIPIFGSTSQLKVLNHYKMSDSFLGYILSCIPKQNCYAYPIHF
jgi:hypothetical protein